MKKGIEKGLSDNGRRGGGEEATRRVNIRIQREAIPRNKRRTEYTSFLSVCFDGW